MTSHLTVSKVECFRSEILYTKLSNFLHFTGFGFDEKFLNAAESEKVIEETHEAWKKLKSGETEAGKLWVN